MSDQVYEIKGVSSGDSFMGELYLCWFDVHFYLL